jgi:hypothetical protein
LVWSRDKSAQMYAAFLVESITPGQDELRAYLSFKVGRSLKTICGIRLETRRCDCSFVLAYAYADFGGETLNSL